ncbi:hypothetical protein [Catenulispora sp. MAP12-49]|uniref:hypothetical protein n=1 Tax=Catenulispora sp. MAP12-49 TaxID=3156302 RepID=UPI003515A8F0
MTADVADTDLKPLLEYAVSTTPHPLSASSPDPDGTVAHGALDILVTNTSTQAVYCHSIQILLPIGESAQDLTANPDSIAPHVVPADTWQGDWSTVAPQDDVVVLVPATETTMFPAPGTRAATTGTPVETRSTAATPLYVAQTKAFTLTPAQGQADPIEITTRGLHLHLSGIPINREPGIATIHILENSGTTADKDTFQERRMHQPVAKYSYRPPAMTQPEGVGRNLVALRAGGADQSTPVTLTTATTGFYLRWAHYDGEYHQLYADGQLISGIEYNGSRWPAEGGITVTRDITYALKTAVSDDTGANVTRWDYLTLPAEHPTYPEGLTVATNKNLIANGPIQANDTVTVAANRTLTTNGPIQANDTVSIGTATAPRTLTTNGPVQANGDVTVTGAAQALSLNVGNGAVIANTDGATVATGKTLSVVGTFEAKGQFRALTGTTVKVSETAARGFGPWTWKADRDGFLTVRIRSFHNVYGGNYWRESDMYHRATITVGGVAYLVSAPLTSRITNQSDPDNGGAWSAPVPVAKDQDCTVVVHSGTGGDDASMPGRVTIYWTPLGGVTGSQSADSPPFEEPGEPETSASDIVHD